MRERDDPAPGEGDEPEARSAARRGQDLGQSTVVLRLKRAVEEEGRELHGPQRDGARRAALPGVGAGSGDRRDGEDARPDEVEVQVRARRRRDAEAERIRGAKNRGRLEQGRLPSERGGRSGRGWRRSSSLGRGREHPPPEHSSAIGAGGGRMLKRTASQPAGQQQKNLKKPKAN